MGWPGLTLIISHKPISDNGLFPSHTLRNTNISGVWISLARRIPGSARQCIGLADTAKHDGDIVGSLQSTPESLRPRLTIGLASQEAAEPGDHADHFAQRRRFLRRRPARAEHDDPLPQVVLEH